MTLRGVIVSFIMTIVFSIMVLGYAALQQRIDIEAEATVDSTYKVQINSVREKSATGDARSTSVFQYNGLSTTFHVGLTNTTDSITYEIELNNLGTVDAILNNTEVLIDGSNNMKVVRLGVKNGDILLANSLKVLTITVKLTDVTSSEQTANITINLDYTRLKGGSGEVVPEVYDSYKIGDKVTYKGSDWYVIENSNQNQDYVVLLKENVLTATEIGNNYSYRNNNGVAQNKMGYYWGDTCHAVGTYGTDTYTSQDLSGCGGHNDYAGSRVNEVVDNYMTNYLDTIELKEVDGYKARMITIDELVNNLGWTSGSGFVSQEGNNVPIWVYNSDYWVINIISSNDLRYVASSGYFSGYNVLYAYSTKGVRPVINLYKDAIEE